MNQQNNILSQQQFLQVTVETVPPMRHSDVKVHTKNMFFRLGSAQSRRVQWRFWGLHFGGQWGGHNFGLGGTDLYYHNEPPLTYLLT